MKRLWHTIWPTLVWIAYIGGWSLVVWRFGPHAGVACFATNFVALYIWAEDGHKAIFDAYRARWNNYRP